MRTIEAYNAIRNIVQLDGNQQLVQTTFGDLIHSYGEWNVVHEDGTTSPVTDNLVELLDDALTSYYHQHNVA